MKESKGAKIMRESIQNGRRVIVQRKVCISGYIPIHEQISRCLQLVQQKDILKVPNLVSSMVVLNAINLAPQMAYSLESWRGID